MSRKLHENDIGKVFIRTDLANAKNVLLLLRSIGPGTTKVYSFITFTLIDDSINSVGETGYINGPWYEPVDSISEKQIREVKKRYDDFVNIRLKEIYSSRDKNRVSQNKFRKKYLKPDSFYLIEIKEIENTASYSYVLWMDEESSLYIIEIYDVGQNLIVQESIPWTHEPRFGMSYDDALLIFGENGLLKSLIKNIKDSQNSG